MKKILKPIELPLFEAFWILVSILTLVSVGLLTFDFFSPLKSILITLVLIFSLLKFNAIKIVWKDTRFNWIILAILLVSLGMRLNPWLYLEGGQDEGVYVSMSKEFERSGGLKYPDNVYSLLTTELKEKYVKEEGWFSLGFNRDAKSSELTSTFYPAHPLIMSIFGFVFGDENRVWSLTFFAMFSIIGTYLLVSHLTKKKEIGYFAAALLAISPIHLYFSKFPVTEIMALACNISSIYFILKAYDEKKPWYLWLSLLLINVSLYTRLTWIVSIPVFMLLLFSYLTFEKDEKLYKQWGAWGISILLSFFVSTLFYFTKIHFLYKHFYSDIFKRVPEPLFYAILILSPFVIYFLTKKYNLISRKILEFIYEKRNWIFGLIGIWLVYLTVKNFYFMAFTDRFVGTRFDYFWGMANAGWITLKDMALSSLLIYITPLGLIGLILSFKVVNTPSRALIMLFLLMYLGFHFYIVKYTPYHFYYARYQLSEIIPLVLIFVTIFCFETYEKNKLLSLVIYVPIALYSLIYSLFLFQGPVGMTSDFFKQLSNNVEKRDIVLFYNPLDWADNFVFSPLKYYYDYKGIRIDNLIDVYKYGTDIKDYYVDDVFILSSVPLENSKLFYVDKIRFEKGFYTNAIEDKPPLKNVINDWKLPYCDRFIPEKFCSGAIPVKYHKASIDFYLYNYR